MNKKKGSTKKKREIKENEATAVGFGPRCAVRFIRSLIGSSLDPLEERLGLNTPKLGKKKWGIERKPGKKKGSFTEHQAQRILF